VPQANGDRTSSRQQKEDERRAAYVFEQQVCIASIDASFDMES
jgi:hypothetical protein